jgi:hypothetical protein
MNSVYPNDVSVRPQSRAPGAPELPGAAISVVESAVDLVRAEVKLVLAETKKVGLRWVTAVAWAVASLTLLPVAIIVLTLGALLQPSPPTFVSWSLALAPTLLLLIAVTATYISLKKATHDRA